MKKKLSYSERRRQIKEYFPDAKIPLATSKRNKALISRYHNKLFNPAHGVFRERLRDGRKVSVHKLSAEKAKIARHILGTQKGLPKLGNSVIGPVGKLSVSKSGVTVTSKHQKVFIPYFDKKQFAKDPVAYIEKIQRDLERRKKRGVEIEFHLRFEDGGFSQQTLDAASAAEAIQRYGRIGRAVWIETVQFTNQVDEEEYHARFHQYRRN